METEAIPGVPEVRGYSASVLQTIIPKIQIPNEIRVSIEHTLLNKTGADFLNALKDWNPSTTNSGNFKWQEMRTIFERLDSVYARLLRDWKSDDDALEEEFTTVLETSVHLIDIFKGAKYIILFRSVDHVVDLLLLTVKIHNLGLAVHLLLLFLQTVRKKDVIADYLKDRLFKLTTIAFLLTSHFNILSQEYQFTIEDLLKNPELLNPMLKKCEICIDTNRNSHLNLSALEDYVTPPLKNEVILNISSIIKKPLTNLDQTLTAFADSKLNLVLDKDSPLRYALKMKILLVKSFKDDPSDSVVFELALKAQSILFTVEADVERFIKINRAMLNPVSTVLTWEGIECIFTKKHSSQLFVTLLQAKLCMVQFSPSFDAAEVNRAHSFLEKLMANVQRMLHKERSEPRALRRRQSVEYVESVVAETGECEPEPRYSTDERFVGGLVELMRELFLFEDKSVETAVQSDYTQAFDLVAGYLGFLVEEGKDHLKYSPRLITAVVELLKLDMGASASIIKKLLDLIKALIDRPILAYKDVDGAIRSISEEKYLEYLVESIELIDSLFVEPTKSYYIASISQFAKEAAEHSIWSSFAALPESMAQVLNPAVVFLDDILTEVPENLVNPTLKMCQEIGLTDKIINHFLDVDKLDYEFIGFYILFLTKNINFPEKSPNFDQQLDACLTKAFSSILDRNFIKQNIKRFSVADSTNALIVLADEIIDLVNVKHSSTELICTLMDGFLEDSIAFYDELSRNMLNIIHGKPVVDAPVLTRKGWLFSEELKDNFIMFERISQNLVKFMSKFFDIQRTNLHFEFEKRGALHKFLRLIATQPLFDLPINKQRKMIPNTWSRMVNQQGNEQLKRPALKACFELLGAAVEEFRALRAQVSRADELLLGRFLFKQNDLVVAYEVFKDEADVAKADIVLKTVNRYHAIIMVSDMLKASIDLLNKSSFEGDEEQQLESLYPKMIEMEKSFIPVKVKWFLQKLEDWPANIAVGKKEVTFDNFSDYTFGGMEMFSNETTPKAMDRIMKVVLQSSLEVKEAMLTKYYKACAEILTTAELCDEPTYENSFRYSKVIQTFAYMLSNFDGVYVLTTLGENGVLEFCQRAIEFGMRFIKEHRSQLMAIKSIKEVPSKDSKHQKEQTVRLPQDLNNLKYVLETLCPKLTICWKILVEYFNTHKIDTRSKDSTNSQRERLNASRMKALRSVASIMANTPLEVIDVMDKSLFSDLPESPFEGITVILKNVTSGYDTLKHIQSFLRLCTVGAIELLPKFLEIISRTERECKEDSTVRLLSSEKKEEQPAVGEQPEEPQGGISIEGVLYSQGGIPELHFSQREPGEEFAMPEEGQRQPEQGKHEVEEGQKREYETISSEEFVAQGKDAIASMLEQAIKHKLSFYEHFSPVFCSTFVALITKVEPNLKRRTQHLLNFLFASMAEIRSNIFTQGEQKGPNQETKKILRLSKPFLKEFKSNNLNGVSGLKVVASLSSSLLKLEEQKGFSSSLNKEFTVVLGCLTDLFDNIPKLAEIKYVEMKADNFQRRFWRLSDALNPMMQLVIDLNKKIQYDEKLEESGSGKRSSKKASSRLKDLEIIYELKKDLIKAIGSYLSFSGLFSKLKLNLLTGPNLTCLSNMLYYISSDQPELKEMIRSEEVIKKLCRVEIIGEQAEVQVEINTLRGMLCLLDHQVRNDRLIEESIRLEIKEYFHLHSLARATGEKQKRERDEEEGMLKSVELARFDEDFKKIFESDQEMLVRLTKVHCEIHARGDSQWIRLKEGQKYKEFSLHSQATGIVTTLIKEIVRNAGLLLAPHEPREERMSPLVSLSYLVEGFTNLCVRYPLIFKHVLGFNINKTIRNQRNAWIHERFSQELENNGAITFLQFFIRVLLFIDLKQYRLFLIEMCRDTFVYLKGRRNEPKQNSGSVVRESVFHELTRELTNLKEDIKFVRTNPAAAMEPHPHLGVPLKYYYTRLATSTCMILQEVSGMLHNLKYINPAGEINLYQCQKTLYLVIESFTCEQIAANDALYDLLGKTLFVLMKINFLCHANKTSLLEHHPLLNVRNDSKTVATSSVLLNDYESFRLQWPSKIKGHFRKSAFVLLNPNMKEDKGQPQKIGQDRPFNFQMDGVDEIEELLRLGRAHNEGSEGSQDPQEIPESEVENLMDQDLENISYSYDDEMPATDSLNSTHSYNANTSMSSVDPGFYPPDNEMDGEHHHHNEEMDGDEDSQGDNEEINMNVINDMLETYQIDESDLEGIIEGYNEIGNNEENSVGLAGNEENRGEEEESGSSSEDEESNEFSDSENTNSTIPKFGKKKLSKEKVRDGLFEIWNQYPFFEKFNLAGVMICVLIDWNVHDNLSHAEQPLEEFEKQYLKEGNRYFEPFSRFVYIREKHQKENAIVKGVLQATMKSIKLDVTEGLTPGNTFSASLGRRDVNALRDNPEMLLRTNSTPQHENNILNLLRRTIVEEDPEPHRLDNEFSLNDDPPEHREHHLSNILLEEMEVIQHRDPAGELAAKDKESGLELYPAFDCKQFGLPSNFLLKNNIDPLFFSVLDPPMQLEVLRGYASPEELVALDKSPANNVKHSKEEKNEKYFVEITSNDLPRSPINVEQILALNNDQNEARIAPNIDLDLDLDMDDLGWRPPAMPAVAPLVDAQNQENITFINSLSPNFREEILMTCPHEFVMTLTPEMRREAMALRMQRNPFLNFGLNDGELNFGMESETDSEMVLEGLPEEEDGEESDMSQVSKATEKGNNQLDISVFMKINKVRESLIEGLFNSLYTAYDDDKKINFGLFAVLMSNYHNQTRIYDTMFFILENPTLDKKYKKAFKFPPKIIVTSPTLITHYPKVYLLTSKKILNLMNVLSEDFNTFFIKNHPLIKSKGVVNSLSEVQKLRSLSGYTVQENGFFRLIELLNVEQLAASKDLTIKILNCIQSVINTTKKRKRELDSNFVLEDLHIKLLCEVLINDSLEEDNLVNLSSIISMLCTDSSNLNKFINQMKMTLYSLIEPIGLGNIKLHNLLRESKAQGILHTKEFLEVLFFNLITSSKHREKRLIKVFKTIEQLFEKYFEVHHKENKSVMDEETEKEAEEDQKSCEPPIDEEKKRVIREKFNNLLEDEKLFNFWVDLIQMLKYLNDEGVDYIKNISAYISVLQPLIECFFISYKILEDDEHFSSLHRRSKGVKIKRRKKSVAMANFIEEQIPEVQDDEDDMIRRLKSKEMTIKDLFQVMCEKNKDFLGFLIEKDIKLLSTSLSCILKKMPSVISFENKRNFFKRVLKKNTKKEFPLNITVRRSEIFLDSFNQIMEKRPKELKGKLRIQFSGEEGEDAGGPAREWFLALSKEIFNPNYVLFETSATGETFQPNPSSKINSEHIKFFKFVGIVVGKVPLCNLGSS
jgi:hypothetical protein